MPPLYTIGYQGRSLDDFLALLEREEITCVVDVRKNAISRKPGFSKAKLRQELAARGIDYLHLPTMGIESTRRREVKTTADYERLLGYYTDVLLPELDEELERLREPVANMNTALLCYEADPRICHRRIIAEELERRFKLRPLHLTR